MRSVLAVVLVFSIVSTPVLFASGEGEPSLQRSIAKAAKNAAAVQSGINGEDGNPYLRPALVMIGAGALVAILGSTMPQFRTQTDDYDLCAAANGGPTGPSTRVPACDSYRTANKGMLAVGLASSLAGATLLTVSAFKFKSVNIQVTPGRVVIAKTTRF
jgi:hypothetical protein